MKNKKDEYVLLVRGNMKRAYYTALGLLGSYDEAMELSQMAFIRAYKNFDSFDRSKNFFTWYYKILRNLCLNRIRDDKRQREIFLHDQIEIKSDENIVENYENEELKKELGRVLMSLDADDREILIMKEFNNMTYKEISEALGIPVGSVMSRLFYARKKLAKKMESVLK